MTNQVILNSTEVQSRNACAVEATPASSERRYGAKMVSYTSDNAAHQETVTASRRQAGLLNSLISSQTKFVTYFVIGLLLIATFCLGWMAYRTTQRTRSFDGEQNQRLAQLEEQISLTNQQLSGLAQFHQDLLANLSLPAKLWSDFNGGICLIYGSYVFIDPDTGKPVRATMKQKDESGTPVPDGARHPQPATEGEGPIAEVTFEGTGFHVGDGYVLTNRHIAEPWKYSFWPQLFSSLRNAKPRLTKLLAFFPGRPQPYTLKVKLVSSRDDLAV